MASPIINVFANMAVLPYYSKTPVFSSDKRVSFMDTHIKIRAKRENRPSKCPNNARPLPKIAQSAFLASGNEGKISYTAVGLGADSYRKEGKGVIGKRGGPK
ncbi:MAG: hypothetical protein BA872_01750 [Desulfobacterales bacterium C00003060]|nr:MAG: hypothetical protein BA861_05195 [Desulfobacterales bacterium S3730MH5]OEU78362.1 MAG: hypothetical protein BA872_01750 [Desulfobacterales bacterium C00003060]